MKRDGMLQLVVMESKTLFVTKPSLAAPSCALIPDALVESGDVTALNLVVQLLDVSCIIDICFVNSATNSQHAFLVYAWLEADNFAIWQQK